MAILSRAVRGRIVVVPVGIVATGVVTEAIAVVRAATTAVGLVTVVRVRVDSIGVVVTVVDGLLCNSNLRSSLYNSHLCNSHRSSKLRRLPKTARISPSCLRWQIRHPPSGRKMENQARRRQG